MLMNRVQRLALTCATALVATLGASAVQAGVWVGAWDPTYGPPFTNLGWRGSGTFDIPATPPCATTGSACIGGSSVLGGEVTFYDVTAPIPNEIGQITWSTAELAGVGLTSLYFADETPGSAPTQFATGPFPARLPTLFSGVDGSLFDDFDTKLFSLIFVIDYCYLNCDDIELRELYSGPLLYWTDRCVPGTEFCPGGRNDLIAEENRPTLRVTQVPEPANVALLAAAFLAMGVVVGRRNFSELRASS